MFSLFALYELIVIDYVILVYGVLPTGPFHTTPSPPSLPPGGCLDMEPNVNQLFFEGGGIFESRNAPKISSYHQPLGKPWRKKK